MSLKPALFLDRDGVINVDTGYAHQISEIEFCAGIFELCQQAKALGYAIVVVTNQAGVARGLYTEEDVKTLHAWMQSQFAEHGVTIDNFYYCPHHADYGGVQYQHNCLCRKPQPGMLKRAARELQLDLSRSIMIGDRISDMQAAESAGVPQRILISEDRTLAQALPATGIASATAHIKLA
ncbi:D-glycero-beta-D-manno-heptose 1,7-bisphosphate 7-phosphatase [Catenovulum sp. SX2]|uniref:D-glycero-beta-D-manno-heptose 1,7-bisphosphate 7-phosphatase n=1 Tax=Catenovulum sp. SX2 TaxID=3398614 RepID=UPI003F871FD6